VKRAFSMLLVLGLLGCGETVGVGEACTGASDCQDGLSCFNRTGAEITPVCMADCDLGTQRICDDGSVCTEREGGGDGVCYLGGMVADGAPCESPLECLQGSICVAVSDEEKICARACVVDDGSRCGAGQECAALMSGGGFCRDTM